MIVVLVVCNVAWAAVLATVLYLVYCERHQAGAERSMADDRLAAAREAHADDIARLAQQIVLLKVDPAEATTLTPVEPAADDYRPFDDEAPAEHERDQPEGDQG